MIRRTWLTKPRNLRRVPSNFSGRLIWGFKATIARAGGTGAGGGGWFYKRVTESLSTAFSCWRCWRAARIWVRSMFDSELSMVVVLTLLYEGLDNVFALPNLQTPSFKISQVVFAPLQNFCFDVFSKQTSVIATLQSYTAHIWPLIALKFWGNMSNYVYYLLSKF